MQNEFVHALSKRSAAVALALACTIAMPAFAAPVDLSSWTREGTGGTWNLQPGNNTVVQTVNGDPTVFYSDYSAFGNRLSGTVRSGGGDDDYFGFVLGFNAGDLTNAATDFLVIDWKGGTQSSYGCNAMAGLAVSRASAGLGDNAGGWCHQGFGVTELARGATLGNTGWAANTEYTFDLEYTSTNLKVFVNDILQVDLDGSFSDGRFGFYNYSQANVTYAGITNATLPPVNGAVPEPGTWLMMIVGFGAMGAIVRRRRENEPRLRVA